MEKPAEITKSEIKQLKKSAKILHQRFDYWRCKEKNIYCVQCLMDFVIDQFDGLIKTL